TEEPGLFRFLLPQKMAGLLAGTPARDKGVPFVVESDPAESALTRLKDSDIDAIAERFNNAGVRFHNVENAEELKCAIAGVPSREIWKYLALGILLTLIGEIALARWIATQRKAHSAETVTFGTSMEDRTSFRAMAREMLATHGGEAEQQEEKDAVDAGTL
ncbi:MAG: hypothetical protein ACYTF6_14685, partial [Planctomycetota bacterium]